LWKHFDLYTNLGIDQKSTLVFTGKTPGFRQIMDLPRISNTFDNFEQTSHSVENHILVAEKCHHYQ